MRQSLFACIHAMLSLLLPVCDEHEFSEPPLPPVALNLKLRFNFGMGEMEDFKTIYVITRAAEDSTAFEARYQLRIHPSNGKGGFLMDSCLSYSFSHSQLQALDYRLPLEIVPGQYRFRAWVDFVPADSLADYFYDTADFDAITLREPHVGGTDCRDAFRGTLDAEVFPAEVKPEQELNIQMERPLAKFRFVATDLKEFEELRLREAQKDGDLTSTPPPIDLSTYKVVIAYSGFYPTVYNLATDEPIDVRTGVNFSIVLRKIAEEEVDLGFDYMFIGQQESGANVSLSIYDDKGKLVAGVSGIEVPLRRGLLTTVRGKFLTARSSGDVSIDPSFDGEFNLQIP